VEVSGRDHDKFKETELTPITSKKAKPPLIKERPVNLECVLLEAIKLGTHDLFLGQVVAVHVDDAVLDEEGNISFESQTICVQSRPILERRKDYRYTLHRRY